MNNILQFSIDIKDVNNNSEETERTLKNILEDNGIDVLGIMWKASWTEEDYRNGKPPYSSD